MLQDDSLHPFAQHDHLTILILIDVSKELHEAKPVVRGKSFVAARVELATNFVDEIPEHGHE